MDRNAYFIMPRSSQAWRGSEALWITVAGWASAAEKLFSGSYIFTTDRLALPTEVKNYPLGAPFEVRSGIKLSHHVPDAVKLLIKDGIQWKRSIAKANFNYDKPDQEKPPAFIWEQHDIFPGPGRKWADLYGVPLITYVHAPQVWEARKWGVKRPIWGDWIERFVEAKSLRQSDLVACVSQEVADKLYTMGIPEEKVLISPMAVDPDLFTYDDKSEVLKTAMGLNGKTVIGWTGSFRSFHGLDDVVNIFELVHRQVPDTVLMLVGDGFERPGIQQLIEEKGLQNVVLLPGRQPYSEIPTYVSLFDIAMVSAKSSSGFHYSPLKLREFLAAGKATIAPNAGEIPKVFTDGQHLRLFEVGAIEETAKLLIELATSKRQRQELGQKGRDYILEQGTWQVELSKALSKVGVI